MTGAPTWPRQSLTRERQLARDEHRRPRPLEVAAASHPRRTCCVARRRRDAVVRHRQPPASCRCPEQSGQRRDQHRPRRAMADQHHVRPSPDARPGSSRLCRSGHPLAGHAERLPPSRRQARPDCSNERRTAASNSPPSSQPAARSASRSSSRSARRTGCSSIAVATALGSGRLNHTASRSAGLRRHAQPVRAPAAPGESTTQVAARTRRTTAWAVPDQVQAHGRHPNGTGDVIVLPDEPRMTTSRRLRSPARQPTGEVAVSLRKRRVRDDEHVTVVEGYAELAPCSRCRASPSTSSSVPTDRRQGRAHPGR